MIKMIIEIISTVNIKSYYDKKYKIVSQKRITPTKININKK